MDLQLSVSTLHPPVRGAVVVTVAGEVDLSTAPQLEAHLAELVGVGRVVLDLSRLTFLDSSGLGVLVGAHRTLGAAGSSLRLAAAQPQVAKILQLTRLPEVVPTFDTVEAACA